MSDQAPQPSGQLREVFIGRQPILDRDQGLAGYQLLFCATPENSDDNDIAGTQALLTPYGAAGTLGLLGEILAESLTWVQQLGIDAD